MRKQYMTERTQLDRRTVLLGGAAILATFTPGSGRSLLAAQGDPSAGSSELLLEGKTALVTGSTDGLGKEVALRLAALGATVLVHGRNEERGAAVVEQINKETPGSAKLYRADFASLAEVRKLAEAVGDDHRRLHLLINNAGIGSANRDGKQSREVSADGYELRFAVNYLAGYLLTRLLIPNLVAGSPSRIVNVASLAQRAIDFDDVMLEREYDGSRAYAQSKLAQVMFTIDLAEELAVKNITVNALHPATYMDTTMVRSAGVQPRSSVAEGADAVMHLATDPELKFKSGLFFNGKREMKANAAAYDPEARRKLRDLSQKLTQV
jgi:NAD(P)-dependent dehydrogenase (short-subunit alcohol dehydrogenase family)